MHDLTILNEMYLKEILINVCFRKVIQHQQELFVARDGGKGGWNGWFQITEK